MLWRGVKICSIIIFLEGKQMEGPSLPKMSCIKRSLKLPGKKFGDDTALV